MGTAWMSNLHLTIICLKKIKGLKTFLILLKELLYKLRYYSALRFQDFSLVPAYGYDVLFALEQFDFEYLQPVVNYPPDFLLYFNIKTVINLDNKRVMRCFNLSIQVTMPFDIFVY